MVTAAANTHPSRALAEPGRRRRRLGAALIGSVLSVGAIATSVPTSASAAAPSARVSADAEWRLAPTNAQYQAMDITNRYRRNAGLQNVYRSSQVSRAAQYHANDMARRRTMTHTGSNGSNAGQRVSAQGFFWRSVGENVAAGQTSAQQVMTAWMNSSGHRANILNWRYQYIGIGVARGSNGVYYWCMVLVGR